MKYTVIAICAAVGLIIGSFFFTGSGKVDERANNVRVENGVQIVELRAKGGYQPRKSIAEAGIPTVLRVNTTGTFDCSSIIRIPSLGFVKNLPASGSTDIDLGTQAGLLKGSCGMGMYPFEIEFLEKEKPIT